jgi:tetratricopeptide (TPR) repeat protein
MASVSPVRARRPRRGTAVQQARLDKGMTQTQAIAALRRLALRHGIAVPPSETLKRRLSSWENKPIVPEPHYRMLLRELYGRTDAELGFNTDIIDAADGHEDALTEIRARLARSQGVDGALLNELDQHTHRLRLLDRRFGAAMVLDQITSHINLVRQLMTHTVLSRHRCGLAKILADASALAGWQALDTGAIMRAWQHFDLARSSGQEAGDEAVYAHALGEQSYALADLERFPDASALLEEAASVPSLPPLMRSWLAAAQAEMHAYLGDRRAALNGFDQAEDLLPADCDDPTLPYLSLNITHLTRWRGHGLALLGEPEAIAYLTTALEQHNPEFVRAECGLHVDLAHAMHATGEQAEARKHALIAKQLAVQIGSERNRRRVIPLATLP